MTNKTAGSFLENKVLVTDGSNTTGSYQVTKGASNSTFLDLNGRFLDGASTTPGDFTAAGMLVSKAYVDAVATSGASVKETLLSVLQVSSNAQGVRPAFAIYFSAQPDALTVVSLKSDTATTEAFTEGTDWNRGASAASAMTALATAITAGTAFSATYCPDLDKFNSPDGIIVVVTKTTPSANDDFRTWSTDTTNTHVISFNATTVSDSASSPSSNYEFSHVAGTFVANGTDPGANVDYSGKLYLASALVEPQTHWVLNENAWYTWDADASQWNLSSANSVPDATSGAGGGSTKGKLSVDEDYALYTASGILRLQLETSNPTLQFNAGTPKKLGVKYGTSSGLTQGASGLSLLLDSTTSASSGLRLTTSLGLSVKLESAGSGTGGLAYAAADAGLKVDTSDGIALDSNGVKVALTSDGGTSGLKLAGSAGTKTLEVDMSDGITSDSNGIAVNLTSNGGLQLAGSAGSKTLGALTDGSSTSLVTSGGAIQVAKVIEKAKSETLTTAAGDITAGYMALASQPVTGSASTMFVKKTVGSSPLQEYGVDFTIMTNGSTTSYVVWKTSGTGLTGTHPTTGMVGDIVDPDKVIVGYTYANFTPAA